jgi:5'-nucleotidase
MIPPPLTGMAGALLYRFYGGEMVTDNMNIVKPSAFTPGNHEFDAGDKALGAFVRLSSFSSSYL